MTEDTIVTKTIETLDVLVVKEELYSADPDCDHNVVPAPGGGIKCTKCPGWFCY